MDVEIGLAEPTEYTVEERESIATHEAGHATVAYLVGVGRKLDVLSIIKRKDALGLLAHSEMEERYTKRRSEALAMIQISLGGMVAEELFFGESGTGPAATWSPPPRSPSRWSAAWASAVRWCRSGPPTAAPSAATWWPRCCRRPGARDAVENLLHEQKAIVVRLLSENRHIIEALRDALLERDELVDREIIDVIEEAQQEAGLFIDIREPIS